MQLHDPDFSMYNLWQAREINRVVHESDPEGAGVDLTMMQSPKRAHRKKYCQLLPENMGLYIVIRIH
jgi:hypothetical protein